MAAPLRSANPELATSVQFAHFGVLDAGSQSKASTVTSIALNCAVALVLIIISAAARQTIVTNTRMTHLEIAPLKKEEPPKPKVIPPKPKPLPQIVKVEPPKIINVPKPIEQPKPVLKMETPKPVILPQTPQKVIAMAAPKVVNLARPQAASVPNNDAHPSAVRLGSPDSPVPNLHGPAVASVNLARGMPGMNAANTGNGPPATKVNLGSGSPESTSIHGNGAVAVTGLAHGVPGGTGGPGRVAGQVNLGQTTPPPALPRTPVAATSSAGHAPKVISKPKPDYTEEARAQHIEGVVTIHIRVLASGAVEVVGITRGLGHGLDQSAERAIMNTKFEPATDAEGHPIPWDGIVNVAFQLAG